MSPAVRKGGAGADSPTAARAASPITGRYTEAMAALNARRQAAVAPTVAKLRALVEGGKTVAAAAREMGLNGSYAKSLARHYNIRVDPEILAAVRGRRLTPQRPANDAELAERMRKAVAAGMPVTAAGRTLGLSENQAWSLAARHGIKADPEAVKRYLADAGKRGAAKLAEKRAAGLVPKRAPRIRDPHERRSAKAGITEAQQQNIMAQKARTWRNAGRCLPIPTKEEADAAVAAFLAKRAPTICPPAAPVDGAPNAGLGWGRR